MKKESQTNHYKEELAKSQARMKELEEKGTDALSRYDIEIASMGNAEQALSTAKMLVSNHVKYYRRMLKQEPEQLSWL